MIFLYKFLPNGDVGWSEALLYVNILFWRGKSVILW